MYVIKLEVHTKLCSLSLVLTLRFYIYNANSEANRKERPFIVVMQHRPFYCTEAISTPDSGYTDDCTNRAALIRDGNVSMPFGLEELYHKHRVDIVIEGHVHYHYVSTYRINSSQFLYYFKIMLVKRLDKSRSRECPWPPEVVS